MSWAMTSAIRDKLRVVCAVRGSELTIDPSFGILIDSIAQHNETMCCHLAKDKVIQKQQTLLRRHA